MALRPIAWSALAFAAAFVATFVGSFLARDHWILVGLVAAAAVAALAFASGRRAGAFALGGGVLGVLPWLVLSYLYRGMGL